MPAKTVKRADNGASPRRKRGPVAFAPTAEQRTLVANLVAFGLTGEQIASLIVQKNGQPLSLPSLYTYFRRELAEGLPRANAQIAGRLFRDAIDGNTTAQIFWLKTRAHWKETNVLEVGGIPGQPIEVTDARNLILGELEQMAERLGSFGGRTPGADGDPGTAPQADPKTLN